MNLNSESKLEESAKLRASHAHVLTCLACLCTHVPTCLAYLRAHVPACLECSRAHVPACLAYLCAHVPACLACLCAYVPTCLAYVRAQVIKCSCANMPCLLCVPTCSRAITTNDKDKFSIHVFAYIFVIVICLFPVK